MGTSRPAPRLGPRPTAAAMGALGLGLAVGGAVLLGRPPFGIPGALMAAAGTVLVAAAALLAPRRTWDDPWPGTKVLPEDVRLRRSIRIFRVLTVFFPAATLAGLVLTIEGARFWPDDVLPAAMTATFGLRSVTSLRSLSLLRRRARDARSSGS